MGLPTSWCMLSLIHLFWMNEVKKTASSVDRRMLHKYSICGDDALLATTKVGAERYKAIVREFHGLPSVGKHFECTN